MNNLIRFGLMLSVVVALTESRPFFGQTPCPNSKVGNTDSGPTRPLPDGVRADDPGDSIVPPSPAEATLSVPALNGTGPIPTGPGCPTLLSYGFSSGLGADDSSWDSTAILLTVSPYLAVRSGTHHTEFVLQYSPIFSRYTSKYFSGGSLQRVSAHFLNAHSARWKWTLGGDFSYGRDSVRLVAPTVAETVGGIAATAPNSSEYQSGAGIGTILNVNADASIRRSERDTVDLALGTAYSHISGVVGDLETTSARLDYAHRISPSVSVAPFGQFLASNGSVACTSIGGGLGVTWQIAQHTAFSGSGGPQVSTKNCSTPQSFLYNAAFTWRLNDTSQIYVLGGRVFSSPYLGPALWQNTLGTGYQRTIRKAALATFDVSYASSAGIGTHTDYGGVYLSGEVQSTLWKLLNPSVSYRWLTSHTGPNQFNHQALVFSVAWNSRSFPLFR